MEHTMNESIRRHIRIRGIVQGVGARPWIHRLATSAGLTGFVGNDAAGVFIEVQGPRATLDTFVDALTDDPPPLAVIDEVTVTAIDLATRRPSSSSPAKRGGEHDALVPRTWARATTASMNCGILRIAGTGTRSSTARTVVPGSRSCAACPMTGR
jgi:acylphosphatase